MLRIVGNSILLCMVSVPLATLAAPARIDIQLMTTNGIVCTKPHTGEHYRLEVRLQGDVGNQSWPTVPGLKNEFIVGKQQRSELSFIQGVQSATQCFIFELVFPQPGSISLGPVRINTPNGTVYSTSLLIDVQERPVTEPTQQSNSRTFLRWELDKQEVYINECTPCRLALYTNEAGLHIESIVVDRFEGVLTLPEEPVWETVEHLGTPYRRCSWNGFLFAKKNGTVWLPHAAVTFVGARPKQEHAWSMLSAFFNRSIAEQRTAPTVGLSVRELPHTTHPIAGVGSINSLRSQLNATEVMSGKTIELSRTIVGCFVPEIVSLGTPSIEGEGTKIYESRSSATLNDTTHTVTQEFIIHATQPGTYHIPAQEYWFFNPTTAQYEKIITEAHAFIVQPSTDPVAESQLEAPPSNNAEAHNVHTENDATEKEISSPPSASSAWHDLSFPMPFRLWLILILFPPLWVGISILTRSMRLRIARRWRIYRASRQAYKRIAKAQATRNRYVLLQTVDTFVQHLLEITDQSSLMNLLAQDTHASRLQTSWSEFYTRLQALAFGKAAYTDQLATETTQWIRTIVKLARGDR